MQKRRPRSHGVVVLTDAVDAELHPGSLSTGPGGGLSSGPGGGLSTGPTPYYGNIPPREVYLTKGVAEERLA